MKYQIFVICLEYATAFMNAAKGLETKNMTKQQIESITHNEVLKIFEEKQRLTLLKYGVSKEQFKVALEKTFAKDQEIQKYNEEIETMLINATQGKAPPLDVPESFKKSLKPSAALRLLKEQHVMLIETLSTRFREEMENNKEFSMDNSKDVVELIRSINLLDKKTQFIKQHAPEAEGVSYQNFEKLIQLYKRESPEFKNKVIAFDALYGEFCQRLGEKFTHGEIEKSYNNILESSPPKQKESSIIQEVSHPQRKQEEPRQQEEPRRHENSSGHQISNTEKVQDAFKVQNIERTEYSERPQ